MPSDALIDEASRRWPDWQGGRPIKLPNDQIWWFYEPEAVLRDGKPGWTFGPDVPRDVDAILSGRLRRILDGWSAAGDEAGRSAAILTAAWFLLARNYAITAEEFGAIMGRAGERPESEQREFGERLLLLVATACARATGLAEVA
jgi:hypothetical protein